MATSTVASVHRTGFRHEAVLYEGSDEFLTSAATFIRSAVAAGEPTLVAVPGDKAEPLREQFGHTRLVEFADMRMVGANPARLIPLWTEFTTAHRGRRVRGIGEPVWPERSDAELVECVRHEELLNLAFAGDASMWLLCPYDTVALGADVIARARRTHPFLTAGDVAVESPEYRGVEAVAIHFDDPLPEPDVPPVERSFGPGHLDQIRDFVSEEAARTGLHPERVADLVLAVNELATNSLLYGGAQGRLRTWREEHTLVCEVSDSGTISDPLVGRRPPDIAQHGGRGVWMANQLCDLVQLRTSPAGTTIRVHMHAR